MYHQERRCHFQSEVNRNKLHQKHLFLGGCDKSASCHFAIGSQQWNQLQYCLQFHSFHQNCQSLLIWQKHKKICSEELQRTSLLLNCQEHHLPCFNLPYFGLLLLLYRLQAFAIRLLWCNTLSQSFSLLANYLFFVS